jgi:hypothetical protein
MKMIRIDSDSHFTPLDAFDEVDPKYADIGWHFEILPSGRYRVIYKARDPFVPQHIKPLREKDHAASDVNAPSQRRSDEQDVDNLLGGTAAKFFGLKQYL